MIQLGSFVSRANADRLAQELKGKGFRASVSESSGAGRRLYRVRVGPVPDHAAAEQVTAKLRAAGHPGAILPKP
jgi:cell division septation protein DedD